MAATSGGKVSYVEAPHHPEAGDAPGTGRPVNPVPPKVGPTNVHTSPDSKQSRSAGVQEKSV